MEKTIFYLLLLFIVGDFQLSLITIIIIILIIKRRLLLLLLFFSIYIYVFGTEVCGKKLPYTSKEENEIRSSVLKVAGHASYTISTGIMGSQRVREFFTLGSAPHPAGSRKSPAEAFNPGVRTTCIFLSQTGKLFEDLLDAKKSCRLFQGQ